MHKNSFYLLYTVLILIGTINPIVAQVNLEGQPFPKLREPVLNQLATQNAKGGPSQSAMVNTSIKSRDIPQLMGTQKEAIAKWYGIDPKEFDKKCQNDKCVKMDQDGRLFHACAGLAIPPESAEAKASSELPPFDSNIEPSKAFELESMPNAQRTIYLDFDGHITKGTFWNSTDRPEIIHPAMDLNTPGVGLTPDYFTDYELQSIINIWKQVCEDFSPYQVNVTTKEPPLDKLIKFNNTDQEYGIRVVIGGNGRNFLNASYGGIAYVGSFSWANDTPTFAFSDNLAKNPKYIAEVISHEVGHTAGLWHHGTTSGATYYGGDGTWAPIMGVSYGARVGQWSKGEYPLANNKNPDMETMTKHMPFKEDIEASPFYNPKLGEPIYGTIHKPHEVDSFWLELEGGEITIEIDLPPFYPNTDLSIHLKDQNGNIVATHNFHPIRSKTLNVKSGKHTLELFGFAFPGAGNSSYGSTGEYKLTVTQNTTIPKIIEAEITKVEKNLKISGLTTMPSDNRTEFSYKWQVATYNSPNNFVTLGGQESESLHLDDPSIIGKFARVIITPISKGIENTPFVTSPIRITKAPITKIGVNEVIEMTSGLTLNKSTPETDSLIINELSQGHSFGTNPEWIELLTLKEADLRGLQIITKYNQPLKFKEHTLWSNIPEGTVIVIYNGNEKDPLIGPDTFLPHSERLIIANSSDTDLFEGQWAKLRAPEGQLSVNTGFENIIKESYAQNTILIDNIAWILNDTIVGSDARDMKEGSKSLRLRNGYIETQDYLKEGISEISFLYARANFSGDRTGTSPTFQVSYAKKSDPETWIPIGANVGVYNDELLKFTSTLDFDGEYKIRISKISGTKDKRWNIDNLKITESQTMNFVKILDKNKKVIEDITFGYSEDSFKKGFLLPNMTESFTSNSSTEKNNGNHWEGNFWNKRSLGITPGKGNSQDNTNLILSLSSENSGQLPHYQIENAPPGLTIDSKTGRIYGKPTKGGFYNMKVRLSNKENQIHEYVPFVVTQSFKDAFKDQPKIVDNPLGDMDGNGIANIVEFAMGSKTLESKIMWVEDLISLGIQNASSNQDLGNGEGLKEMAIVLIYTRSKIASGISIIPEWSKDLSQWETTGVNTTILEDLQDKQQVVSWVPIAPSNGGAFMRLRIVEN